MVRRFLFILIRIKYRYTSGRTSRFLVIYKKGDTAKIKLQGWKYAQRYTMLAYKGLVQTNYNKVNYNAQLAKTCHTRYGLPERRFVTVHCCVR